MAKEYQTIDDIPALIFSNRQLTQSPSIELLEFLDWMLTNHPNDLAFLWRKSQEYKNHGGSWKLTFNQWLQKLENDLKRQLSRGT